MILGGPPVAKAPDENGPDGEGRRLGERTGLDTAKVSPLPATAGCKWQTEPQAGAPGLPRPSCIGGAPRGVTPREVGGNNLRPRRD